MTIFLHRYKYVLFVLFFLIAAAFSLYFVLKAKSEELPLKGVFVREEVQITEVMHS